MEVSTLASMISEIRGLLVKSSTMIQAVAVQAVFYSVVDSNITPAQQLYDALGSESRKDALLAFLEQFGNMAWSKTEKKIVFFDREKILGKEKALSWTEEYAAKVAGAPWSAAKAPPAEKSMYDCEDAVKTFIRQMEKAIVKGGAKNTNFYDVIVAAYNSEQLGLKDATYCGFAVRALGNGEMPEEVVTSLVSRGCDSDRAKEIVAEFDVVGN